MNELNFRCVDDWMNGLSFKCAFEWMNNKNFHAMMFEWMSWIFVVIMYYFKKVTYVYCEFEHKINDQNFHAMMTEWMSWISIVVRIEMKGERPNPSQPLSDQTEQCHPELHRHIYHWLWWKNGGRKHWRVSGVFCQILLGSKTIKDDFVDTAGL